jgi:hypothetical protein
MVKLHAVDAAGADLLHMTAADVKAMWRVKVRCVDMLTSACMRVPLCSVGIHPNHMYIQKVDSM